MFITVLVSVVVLVFILASIMTFKKMLQLMLWERRIRVTSVQLGVYEMLKRLGI